MTRVEITNLAAEHLHGIGADGANAIDGYGTHEQPPGTNTTTSPADGRGGTGQTDHRTSGRTTPSATTCRRASSTEPPPAGTVAMS